MKCKVCNSNSVSIQTDVYKCTRCSHVYVDFRGDALEYHKTAYRKNNYGTRGNGEIKNGVFTESFHKFRKPICESRISKIKHLIDDSDSMFDIGAGGGTFLNTIFFSNPSFQISSKKFEELPLWKQPIMDYLVKV